MHLVVFVSMWSTMPANTKQTVLGNVYVSKQMAGSGKCDLHILVCVVFRIADLPSDSCQQYVYFLFLPLCFVSLGQGDMRKQGNNVRQDGW